jgi:signal transduction histidine kinase
MNPLNPFAISGLLIIISYLPVYILLIRNAKSILVRIYSLHILSVIIWGIGSFFIGLLTDFDTLKIIWGIAYTGVLFIPVFLYHAVQILSNRKSPIKLLLCYGQAILFTILITLQVIKNGKSQFFLFYDMYFIKNSFTFSASFICWLILSILSHYDLYKYSKEVRETKKHQAINLLWAFTGFIGGMTNFFPAYGIPLYPYGNFLVPLHSFFITYAIFQHRLFDLKIAIRKGAAYSILVLTGALLYFTIIIISERFIQGFWGYKSITISILTAFTVGILFFPLHNRIQKFVDRIIFKRTTEEISKENELLRAEVLKTEKLKSVAILASGMAHEIKNPLTALKTFSEYLPKKLDDKEFLMKFSKIVGGEVDRIDGLVTQLLEFAKPSPVQLQKANINKLIKDTLDFLSNKCIDHNIQATPELAAECDEPIMIDPQKMRQVFLNLFLNALDAMPNGGRLTIVSAATENSVLITVTDTGCGIAKENLAHIFDPFFSTKDTGTGLGLPITYGIIKEHGGEIKVKSTLGTGTTFVLTLPEHRVTC